MTTPCALTDETLIALALDAADDVLASLRLGVAKALDLGTVEGFDQAIVHLAGLLRGKAALSDQAAVKAALEVLDVEWKTTTAEQRKGLIARALEAAGRRTRTVPATLQPVFDKAATEVVRGGRDGVRRGQRLTIAMEFNAIDKRILRHIRTSHLFSVRDEYGRRHEAFGKTARQLVADGLEQGLGRDDIATTLASAAEGVLGAKGSAYWEVLAGSFVAQGRSFSQLSAYAEARIERYRIEAILDERTTEVCRFLDGKTFAVSSGLHHFERLEADPEHLTDLAPWVRERLVDGRKELFVEHHHERLAVAEVLRSGFGTREDRGEFGKTLSERELVDLGISFPPFHGLCRSSTVAEV